MVISRNASRWSHSYRYRSDDTHVSRRVAKPVRSRRSVPAKGSVRGMTGPAQTEERLSEVRFLTVAEVAALMRVSKMTVYRLVHGGDLTAVRVGRSFRVPEHAVHDYLRGAFSRTAWGRGLFGPASTGPLRWCGWLAVGRARSVEGAGSADAVQIE